MSQTTTSQLPSTQASQRNVDVQLHQVFKVFNRDTAVRGVTLHIQQGEFFSILGPSGCGKTTTLRLIAGFEAPTAGSILIQDRDMGRVPSYRRPVNTVFQSYALFNHMSVWDNVAFGLKIKRLNPSLVNERVQEVLQLVKMESFAPRFPNQLSGGQQQRVALARALVNRPAVVLLDEPLGALDLKLRKQMQMELSNLHRQLGITFVMVTHDQEEALSLSDRIAVMNDGQIEQIGTPSEIYDCPQTPFVADFIGDTNLISGRIDQIDPTMMLVITNSGLKLAVQRGNPNYSSQQADNVVVSIRPEKIHLSQTPPTDGSNCYTGQVSHVMYLGTHIHCVIRLASGEHLTVLQPNRSGNIITPETTVYAYWQPQDCLALKVA